MHNLTKKIIIFTIIITLILFFCSGCSLEEMLHSVIWTLIRPSAIATLKQDVERGHLPKEDLEFYDGLLDIKDEDGNMVSEVKPLLKESEKDKESEKTPGINPADAHIAETFTIIGIEPDISAPQIVQSASEPPQDQIPVVDMPQEAPDIPGQDDRTTVADAEPPQDSPDHHDDKSPIPTTPGTRQADEPEDIPDTTEEQPSYGEQEQPHHEHDIYSYYQEDIVEGENIQSITITVNIATREVYGNHCFEGYIGSGYRTATYAFETYLDASDRFSTTSTATIYEDGHNIGEGTLKITGKLAYDMSFIAGDIIDETLGYGIMYYAYLISQIEEKPEKENY
jgi:hypothetical protein